MRYTHIFKDDIEVPEIVLIKVDEALTKIQAMEKDIMPEKLNLHNKTRKKLLIFRNQAAAITCVFALAVTGITAVAAAHYFWSRGMRGTLLATKEQQQSLIEQGMVKNLQQEKNEYVAPVTVGDIKISPMEMVVDDYFAFISFKVEGFELAEGEEPCFEKVKASLVNGEKYMVNLGGSFYYGVVPDENGKAVYEDGTPMEVTEDGEGIYHYEAADGSLEFVMTLQHADINESLIGKTVHISFENIGIAQKTTVVDREIGKWEFDIPLSGKSAGEIYEIGTQLEGTVFTVDSIELSPISARVNYTVNEDASLDIGYNRVPEFAGVLLKDGKERKYLSNAGKSGYTDDAMQKAFDLKSFVRVIDLDQVEAVFIREFKKSGEIELHVIYFEEDKSF